MKGHFRRVSLCVSVAILYALFPGVVRAQNSADEYELKAAMLYNMMQFVEWPPSAYPDPQAPSLLCVLGWDPFGTSLSSLVSKKTVNGRPVQLLHFQNSDGVRACHVLYVSSSERKNVVQILSSLRGSAVLTVGDMAQFAARGGIVQFALEEKQVRLDINLNAASRADLKISSRLLLLARIVKDDSKPRKEGSAVWSQAFEVAASQRSARSNAPQRDSEETLVSIGTNSDSPRRR